MVPITKRVQTTQCWKGYRRDCIKKRTCTHWHIGEVVGELISEYTAAYGPLSPQAEQRKPYTMRKRSDNKEQQEENTRSIKYSMRKRSHQSMEESEKRIPTIQRDRNRTKSPKKRNKLKETYIQSILNKKISEDIQERKQQECRSKGETDDDLDPGVQNVESAPSDQVEV